MNTKLLFRSALTTLIVAAAAIGAAQAIGGMRVGGSLKVPGPLQTYGAALVQQEIGVTAEQKAKIDPLLPDHIKSGKMVVNSPEDFDEMLRLSEKAYVKVKEILTEKQVQRLEEIHRQMMGARGMLYEPYAKTLELTESQKESISETYSSVMSEMMQDLQPEDDGNGRMRIKLTPEKSKMIDKEVLSRLGTVLSKKQLDKWKEMQGKPYEPKKDK